MVAVVAILTVVLADTVTAFAYYDKVDSNIDIALSIFKENAYSALMTTLGIGGFMAKLAPIGIIVMTVGAVACAVVALIGLISGKVNALLPILGAVAVVGAVVTVIGFVIPEIMTVSVAIGSIGLLVAIIASVLSLVSGIAGTCVVNKAKKEMVIE